MISSYNITVQICANSLKIGWSQNALFAASRGSRRKREAAFAASQECASRKYVTVQELKGVKCAVQGRIFNPTNLLNHVAPSIELTMQMCAI